MRKISGLLFLIPLLVLAIAATPAGAPGVATISIDPQGTVGLAPGSTFSVDVVISDVTNLGGYKFELSYDNSLLHVTDVTVVEDWFTGPLGIKVWKQIPMVFPDYSGSVFLWVTLGMGTVVGVEGSGTVATIEFAVDGEGLTLLDLHDTLLGDPWAVPIIHHVSNGVFANIPLPQLWIKDKGAMGGGIYPEWHVNVPGAEQTLYARIVNTGDVGCYIKVEMHIYNPSIGGFVEWTGEAEINPKPIDEAVTVSATFAETDTTGVYYVSGTLHFSLDGTLWIPYTLLEEVVGGRGTSRDIATKFKTLPQWTPE